MWQDEKLSLTKITDPSIVRDEWIGGVSPAFRPIYDEDVDVILLWGGRDSGKSYSLAEKMVFDCMTTPYFRCILVKKTYESIKDSQYQGIKDFIHDEELQDHFSFKTSPLEITYLPNGNKFIARGCDKPEKLKSIKDPSHAWYEEGNQLSEQDYVTISTTLRTDKAKVQECFSFNPESSTSDYKDFWVHKRFFNGTTDLNFKRAITTTYEIDGERKDVTLTHLSIHTTYKDNKFVTPERIARHEDLKRTNPHYYQVFTLGLWGNQENDTPYFLPFSRDKHAKGLVEIDLDYPLYFSFDFNLDPCTVVIGQKLATELRVIDVMTDSNGTAALCHKLMSHECYLEHPSIIYVTGDNSGYSGSSVGGRNGAGESINDYIIIVDVLQQYRPSFSKRNLIRPNKANRTHQLSRVLCNAIFNKANIQFDIELTNELIAEIEKAIPDPTSGEKLFKHRSKGYEMDKVDAMRYLFNAWFPKQLKDLNNFI